MGVVDLLFGSVFSRMLRLCIVIVEQLIVSVQWVVRAKYTQVEKSGSRLRLALVCEREWSRCGAF
jgi:hypothetical protein